MKRTDQIIATHAALAAFAVAIFSGLIVEASAAQVLTRSIVAMICCYLIGWGVGQVCQRVIAATECRESARDATGVPIKEQQLPPPTPRGMNDGHEKPFTV